MVISDVREGTFSGGLPYLAVGSGEPLVYLCGSTPNHRNPKPGVERTLTLRTINPLARAGFEVYFTNRWPGMAPDISFAEVAERHADAILDHFGQPVDVLGASTGGSLALQLIADRPDAVRKAVVACAAYTLGPLAKRTQEEMLRAVEETGGYSPELILDLIQIKLRWRWIRTLLAPLAMLAAKRVTIENPTDTIAMLRAEDAFDVRDRLTRHPNRDTGGLRCARPLLDAGNVCGDGVPAAERKADHVSKSGPCTGHKPRILPRRHHLSSRLST